MKAVDFPVRAVTADPQVVANLEQAMELLGHEHVRDVARLLVDAGWCLEDARDATMHVLAASHLIAAHEDLER